MVYGRAKRVPFLGIGGGARGDGQPGVANVQAGILVARPLKEDAADA
jgi:hypothetical protein